VTKLLKYSVLALALVLGSSTYAHAESVALTDGGVAGFLEKIFDWLFPHSSGHSNNNGTGTGNPNVAPEIDPGLAMSGFMLLGGTLTVLRSRRKETN